MDRETDDINRKEVRRKTELCYGRGAPVKLEQLKGERNRREGHEEEMEWKDARGRVANVSLRFGY